MNESQELMFSGLSGYNYYKVNAIENGIYRCTHFTGDIDVDVHFYDHSQDITKWKRIVEYPVDVQRFVWPIDIVEYEISGKKRLGTVFLKRAFPKLEPIKTLLYDDEKLDWRQSDIKKIIIDLLECFGELRREGYLYNNINLNRIFLNQKDDNKLLFSFSPHMAVMEKGRKESIEINKGNFGIEFLPPWVNLDSSYALDEECENYSVTALLFRLMIGRMPYQGRLMDGVGHLMNKIMDTDELLHTKMMEEYLKHPKFIFEEGENENSIGIMQSEEIYIERWEALPDTIKSMFNAVLCEKNVTAGNHKRKTYTPDKWLRVIEKIGRV